MTAKEFADHDLYNGGVVRSEIEQLAAGIMDEHRDRKNGVGAGHCVACREKWPCKPWRLALLSADAGSE